MRLTYKVREIMTKDLIGVENTTLIEKALQVIAESDVGSAVVRKKGEIVGIMTERDVLKKCCCRPLPKDMKAEDVMSSPLVTIDADATFGEAASLMSEKKIRRLLVTEKGKIQGIITERDIMYATLDVFKTLSGGAI